MNLILNEISFQIHQNRILKDIHLQFLPGVLYCILGPNGSGKSTLLQLISGIRKPNRGNVLWNGENLHSHPRRTISSIVSLVPQSPQILFDFTVEEIVKMGQYAKQQRNTQAVLNAMGQADLLHLKNRPITQLSIGERQRVYIARSLAAETPIMLLDEPTSNLDIHHQLAIWKLLREFVAQGIIVIVTVHDLMAARKYFDEIVVLSKGECVSHGSFEQAVNQAVLRDVFQVGSEVLLNF